MADSIVRKMLTLGPQLSEPDMAVDGLAGVLGKSASVVGLTALGVQLEAQSRAAKPCDASQFIDSLPKSGLYFGIACEGEDQIGLLAIDASLIETINHVLTGELEEPQDSPREPTAVDTAMCRPFLDEMLQEFASILRELRGGKTTYTYQTKQVENEPSPHQFPEIPFFQIAVDVDFLAGKAKGQLSVMIPVENTEFTSALPPIGDSTASWRKGFTNAVEAAPACLDVVLHRKKMPIGQILKLKKGDMLTIPARALENLSIESRKGPYSRSLMRARLGEYQEMRAAKITLIGEGLAASEEPKLLETADVLDE